MHLALGYVWWGLFAATVQQSSVDGSGFIATYVPELSYAAAVRDIN
jgi:hypothetical protein